jgi:membrane protein DedA with SNARE-associated domain
MFFSFPQILALLQTYKYLVLFPIAVIEGPIITIIAGFLVAHGYLGFLLTYILLIIADVAGDALYYAIGYFGNIGIIERWGRLFGVTPERIRKIEEHFAKHSGTTLVFGKFSHVTGAPILIAAGIAKMPLPQFLFINFLSTIPKSFALLLVGYYFGYAYQKINQYFGYATWAGAIVIAAILLVYIVLMKIGTRVDERL